jgi:cysteine synthase A
VVPASTAPGKLDAISRSGAKVHLARAHENTCAIAEHLALEIGGHYMNQFMYAERATDWRGNNNIAESLFQQLSSERHPIPKWIVVGAGTGGTSATIGRYIRYRPDLASTQLMVVDPTGSAFYRYFCTGDRSVSGMLGGIVEGIGRASVEPSFMRNVIDEMIAVPDAASIACAYWIEQRLSLRFGPSTGTNIVGALTLAAQMHAQGLEGSIATLACDSGERYADTIYDAAWLKSRGIDIAPWQDRFAEPHLNSRSFCEHLPRAQSGSTL